MDIFINALRVTVLGACSLVILGGCTPEINRSDPYLTVRPPQPVQDNPGVIYQTSPPHFQGYTASTPPPSNVTHPPSPSGGPNYAH
ncbi:MAG: hypothetical protein CMF50_06565 [Legionellales bacterium]|nr:hypothetical protein [Legionellales bacterium]